MTASREYEMTRRFLDKYRGEISAGEPVNIQMRDVVTFEAVTARALVSEQDIEGADTLWIKDLQENRFPKPWHVKVLELLDDDQMVTSMPPIF